MGTIREIRFACGVCGKSPAITATANGVAAARQSRWDARRNDGLVRDGAKACPCGKVALRRDEWAELRGGTF